MGRVRVTRLLLAALVATSCSAGEGSQAAPATPTRADPVTACTNQVVYWTEAELRGEDDGGDYQHHGLTSEQYDAVRAIVSDVQARGTALPPDHVAQRARAACERIVTLPPSGF
jgi:hypothetical protein